MSIDLETGEPDPDESPSARRRRERRESGGGSSSSGGRSSSSGSKGSGDRENTGLASRLNTAFSKIADQMAVRGDEELATALREERSAMSQGLVSLTSTLTPLRWPLVVLLSLVEPFLAFWRVGRILFFRFLNWRERRIIEAQQQQAEYEAAQAAEGAGVVS